MTSKEALEILLAGYYNNANYQEVIEAREKLEKDLERLEQYKSIEEELGIDLIKAVELCKQVNSKKVVYIKDEYGIYPIKNLDDLDVKLFHHRLYSNYRGIYVSLDLNEYGKTWALDKQTLEK